MEEEKAEETAASVAAQKKAAVVRAERRRQLKNALLWQRESVRTPLDLNTTRSALTVSQEHLDPPFSAIILDNLVVLDLSLVWAGQATQSFPF